VSEREMWKLRGWYGKRGSPLGVCVAMCPETIPSPLTGRMMTNGMKEWEVSAGNLEGPFFLRADEFRAYVEEHESRSATPD